MKNSILVGLLCTLIFVGCKSTSSDDNTYSIEVTNTLQFNLDIYTQAGTSGEQTLQGTLNASSMATYEGFEEGIQYTITATEVGGSPDNWYFRTEFNEDSSSVQITPQF